MKIQVDTDWLRKTNLNLQNQIIIINFEIFMADSFKISSIITDQHPTLSDKKKKDFLHAKVQPPMNLQNKKQIINLESSEQKEVSKKEQHPKTATLSHKNEKEVLEMSEKKEKEGQNLSKLKIKERKPIQKKIALKCILCKGSGKKNELKTCVSCKFYFHINCLEENYQGKKYVCDRCRIDKLYETKASKKQKRVEQKLEQLDKTTIKKMEKERKKDECTRTLKVFSEKYPYYLSEDEKIKYPIEDKLLYIYREYFEPSQMKVMPTSHPIIPSKYLSNLLEIQNFLFSFEQQISQMYSGEKNKVSLYHMMNCSGSDETFESLLNTFILIYLKDIYERNKTENVKYLNDNQFFITLGNLMEVQKLNPEEFVCLCPQIIHFLSQVPSMKKAFQNLSLGLRKKLQKPDLQIKVTILATLIQGFSEIDAFHEMVSKRSQKMSEMTKEKANVIVRLKKDEAEVLSTKEQIKQIAISLKSKKLIEDAKIKRQMEKERKKIEKMNEVCIKSEEQIRKLRLKVMKITKMIPFTISKIMFLGTDRNKSQYYFFYHEPTRVYVQYRNFLLDTSNQYKIFEGRSKIIELIKSLNIKGINEKHLYESLNYLLKEEFFIFNKGQQPSISVEPIIGKAIFQDSFYKEKAIEKIMKIQMKFSNYLNLKNYQWASPQKREQFLFGFKYIEQLQPLKEAIKIIHEQFLFVEIIKEKELFKIDSDSQFEELQRETAKRKKPIRIWGINTEKIKRFWVQYLENTQSYLGIWICVLLFSNYVDNYVDKKFKTITEGEKQLKGRQESRKSRKGEVNMNTSVSNNTRNQKNKSRININQKNRKGEKKGKEVPIIQISQNEYPGKPNLRLRKRNKTLVVDSDSSSIQCEQIRIEIDKISSEQSEGHCQVCNEYGTLVCCDTCPKMYHLKCLKLKSIPDGDWSCIDCLERFSHVRQTRSMKNLKK